MDWSRIRPLALNAEIERRRKTERRLGDGRSPHRSGRKVICNWSQSGPVALNANKEFSPVVARRKTIKFVLA